MSNTGKAASAKLFAYPGETVLSQLFWISLFAAATAAGARLEIPHDPVPYTLQTLIVLLAGAFLGPRNGAISQLIYLGAGALGLPVFAGGALGPGVLFGPTAGYLLAFPIAAATVGYLVTQERGLAWSLASMALGLLLIFASGTLFLFAFVLHNLASAISAGFLIFTWWDLIKLCAAAMIYHEFAKRWSRLPE